MSVFDRAEEEFELVGTRIALGETRDLELTVTQNYSGTDVDVPLRVIRGPEPGPSLLLVATIHGDELNGIGILREFLADPSFGLKRGTLVLAPVINLLGYERQTRYLPDRRDLNRCFPGNPGGSLAARIADTVFQELILRCDALIDFHTAAVQRTNFPNVRADLSDPDTRRLAFAFGCSLVVASKGAEGTLRRAAVDAGRPAIILEAGEVWKVEPGVVEVGVRGVRNVLIDLGMIDGESERPPYQAWIKNSHWLRSEAGGLLSFHVSPGDVVEKGRPVATCTTLLGAELAVMLAPEDSVVMGLTTLPSVKPGDPICHLAVPRDGVESILKVLSDLSEESLHERLRDDLAANVVVDDPDEERG